MFRIAPIFSDRMVLQKGRNINVFGTGEDGSRVTVEFRGFTAETSVKDGKWLAVLPAQPDYAEGLELTVDRDQRAFREIAAYKLRGTAPCDDIKEICLTLLPRLDIAAIHSDAEGCDGDAGVGGLKLRVGN